MEKKFYPTKKTMFFHGPFALLIMYGGIALTLHRIIFQYNESEFMVFCLLLILYTILVIFAQIYLIPTLFGILTVTDEHIELNGFLVPKVKLRYDEIKSFEIATLDDNEELIHTYTIAKYLVLSESPVKRKGKTLIYPSKRKKRIVFLQNEELCKALVDKLPHEMAEKLEYQLSVYEKYRNQSKK